MGINCEMLIIGYGPEDLLLKELVNELDLQENVF